MSLNEFDRAIMLIRRKKRVEAQIVNKLDEIEECLIKERKRVYG